MSNSMKATKTLFVFTVLALAALTASAWAEDPVSGAPAAKDAAATPAAPAPAPAAVTAADVQALKDALASQQLQLQRLEQQLERQQEQQAAAAKAAADTTTHAVPPQQVAAVTTGAAQQTSEPHGMDMTGQTTQEPDTNPMHSPVISIHFKGITITPGGFVEAAFVRRSRALAADLPTHSIRSPCRARRRVTFRNSLDQPASLGLPSISMAV
jgi:hypothetical protein